MKNLVDAREFDAFKKKVLDPGILTEYEVLLHGSLLERDGELAYFKIPPQTAVVMFNLPGYLTTMYVKKDILSENEKKKLRYGNLSGRSPDGKYAYSVMYVSGDTVPDVKVDFRIDSRLGKKGTGIFNASGKRLDNPKQESLSAIIASLGPGLYFVPSCRPMQPTLPWTSRYMKKVKQIRKMQLMNLIARSRQRPYSPGTNMRLEPYAIMRKMPGFMEITKLSNQMSGFQKSKHELGVVEHIISALIVVLYLSTPVTSIMEHGVVTGVVRLPIDLFYVFIIQLMVMGMYQGAVRVTRRGHQFLTSLARRSAVAFPPKLKMGGPTKLTVSDIMRSAKLNPNNENARVQIRQRLLRKYGFNVGNTRDIERKFYIHMQRIPLSNRKRHSELNLAKRIADNRTRFTQLKSHK